MLVRLGRAQRPEIAVQADDGPDAEPVGRAQAHLRELLAPQECNVAAHQPRNLGRLLRDKVLQVHSFVNPSSMFDSAQLASPLHPERL